eukprot:1032065-Pelagomonas_calceolata.AAC.1
MIGVFSMLYPPQMTVQLSSRLHEMHGTISVAHQKCYTMHHCATAPLCALKVEEAVQNHASSYVPSFFLNAPLLLCVPCKWRSPVENNANNYAQQLPQCTIAPEGIHCSFPAGII